MWFFEGDPASNVESSDLYYEISNVIYNLLAFYSKALISEDTAEIELNCLESCQLLCSIFSNFGIEYSSAFKTLPLGEYRKLLIVSYTCRVIKHTRGISPEAVRYHLRLAGATLTHVASRIDSSKASHLLLAPMFKRASRLLKEACLHLSTYSLENGDVPTECFAMELLLFVSKLDLPRAKGISSDSLCHFKERLLKLRRLSSVTDVLAGDEEMGRNPVFWNEFGKSTMSERLRSIGRKLFEAPWEAMSSSSVDTRCQISRPLRSVVQELEELNAEVRRLEYPSSLVSEF